MKATIMWFFYILRNSMRLTRQSNKTLMGSYMVYALLKECFINCGIDYCLSNVSSTGYM